MASLSHSAFISSAVFKCASSSIARTSLLPRTPLNSRRYTTPRPPPTSLLTHNPPSTPSPPPSALQPDHPSSGTSGIRINKCFTSFASRRESDLFVSEQRVKVNGAIALPGTRVRNGDLVELDGRRIDWERLTVDVTVNDFVYLKHWKALDTICTTDTRIPNNIIHQSNSHASHVLAESHQNKDRIFPIGRLDQASTGIILLTSDGRLPNAVLGASNHSCEKVYIVRPDMPVSDEHISHLQKGVVIKTVAQRDRNVRKPHIARTLPCKIRRASNGYDLIVTLTEGRNRQIRKMMGALGYTTRAIHRISFMGISLDGLSKPGETCPLNEDELKIIKSKL